MKKVVTPMFRVSYPYVFKSNHNKLSGKDEFSVVALFPKNADLSQLKALAEEAVKAKWGAKRPKNLRSPFRDQGEKEYTNDSGQQSMPAGHEKGAIFINLKSKNRPQVVDQNVQTILDESDFYPGCYARATVSVYAYEQAGNCGVSFGLQNIQKMKDGDPFGGRSKAEDDFAPVEGANDAASLF